MIHQKNNTTEYNRYPDYILTGDGIEKQYQNRFK